MGMHFKTAYNHHKRVMSQIAGLYQWAQQFGMLSSEICDKRNAIVDTLPKNYPSWILHHIEGWEQCMRGIIARQVVFCYTVDGKLYSTHRNRDDYYKKHGFGPKEVYDKASFCGHYWDINGVLKLYHGSEIKRDSSGKETHE